MDKKHLLNEHLKRKKVIKKRLKEFSIPRTDKQLFLELCYCLCTPQSNAKKVSEVIHEGNLNKLLHADIDTIKELLRRNARFHNNKAGYIINARRYIKDFKSLPKDTTIARDFLVKNIKGLGLKESSHYLRNIGYRNICIIDRHVINIMHELNVFSHDKPPKNAKEYLFMEQQVKNYAKQIGIDVDELDLVLWSMRTGFVLK
jgi:N-glycosylase/DNA lyase